MKAERMIRTKCAQIRNELLRKNRSYGDSALRPMAIFGSGDAVANLSARIDDKLARVKNAPGAYSENELLDLTGYLILLQIALENRARKPRKDKGLQWSKN